MLFNSLEFLVFFPTVFLMYWFITNNNLRLQNFLILVVSYIFYGWWDWRFLSLIAFSTLIDFGIGLLFSKQNNKSKRKILLSASIVVNLGILGFFKYYNFFIDNFVEAFSFIGITANITSLNIILPVGISFYTFQTLSYSIDVYRRKIKPSKDLISFAAFVSFFPQLVAGPIERASNLIPQFTKKRTFDYSKAVDGLQQILWGLFKKVVIADNCAIYANDIFNNSGDYSGSTLILGALFFTFQIYGDFSGYSDMAIGIARLFGFNLMKNFSFPYFSRDIAEFWRRWHISLSTWFRDYLYIPLGGSKGGLKMKIRNTFLIFIVSGFWHGANWTFIVWGALNAVYFLPLLLTNNNRNNLDIVAKGRYLPSIREFLSIISTFLLTVLTWIFFRAENIKHAIAYIQSIFSTSLFSKPRFTDMDKAIPIVIIVIAFVLIEWFGREGEFGIARIKNIRTKAIKWALYILIALAIFFLGNFNKTEFIYFAF